MKLEMVMVTLFCFLQVFGVQECVSDDFFSCLETYMIALNCSRVNIEGSNDRVYGRGTIAIPTSITSPSPTLESLQVMGLLSNPSLLALRCSSPTLTNMWWSQSNVWHLLQGSQKALKGYMMSLLLTLATLLTICVGLSIQAACVVLQIFDGSVAFITAHMSSR